MICACLAAFMIFFTATAAIAEECLSCHGQKGTKDYVNKAALDRSVHGGMGCTMCHRGMSSYPHGRVMKVNCGACHLSGWEGAPSAQARAYRLSVHGQALLAGNTAAPNCQTCHGSHDIYRSQDERSRTFRWKIPSLCSQCHPGPFKEYSASIHGRLFLKEKKQMAPTCFDCHDEHRIPSTTENWWKLYLISKCGTCHAEQLNTYGQTYHGQVTRLGYTTIAKCWNCHGSHLILPPSDPDSKLSDRNITATCGSCHPGATRSFTKFYAHAEESNRAGYPVLYYTYLFMTTLLISVFAFFLTHTILWAYRGLRERMKKGGD